MRILFASVCLLALAACGQPSTQSSSSGSTASSSTASSAAVAEALSPEQIAAGLAELPPPYNEGDYEAGRRIFMQCSSCHLIADSPNRKSGPNLHGVYGAVSGHRENFNYSPAMRNAGLTWDAPTLDRYLENPRAAVPGTIMAFVGVRDPEQRRDLVAYLAIESKR